MRKETWVFVGWTSSKRRVKMGHRYPGWMPLKLHLILEQLINDCFREIAAMVPILLGLYNFIYGAICGYPLPEILAYLESEREWTRVLKGTGRAHANQTRKESAKNGS